MSDELVGKYFVQLVPGEQMDMNGKPGLVADRQGRVMSLPSPGFALVEIFGNFDTFRQYIRLYKLANMTKWEYYVSARGMQSSFLYYAKEGNTKQDFGGFDITKLIAEYDTRYSDNEA